MRKNILFAVLPLLVFGACSEKKLSDEEILKSRPETTLEVSYSSDGNAVQTLAFTSKAAVKTVDVSLNSENLIWNIESDRDWCAVRKEAHRGDGSFTLEIAANDDFEARDAATLTFVAGNFRGFKISVTQNGSAFIISQPYFIAGKEGGSFAVDVTTPEGIAWEVVDKDWLTSSTGSPATSGGYTTTSLSLTVAENSGSTRYDALILKSSDGEEDQIAVAQFGTDLPYFESQISFSGEEDAVLTFLAPEYLIDSFILPDYATSEVVPNGDGTVTVTISLEQNYSDCSEVRESALALKLTNSSASVVTLPTVQQGYVPAHGLVTAMGVQRFAAAVAAGEDTSDWETNGVVILKGDIDMTGVEGWTGIGTDEKPFTGKFNGDGHSILNLKKAVAGFFHKVSGATISNLTIAKNCGIYKSGSYAVSLGLGGIADEAAGSSFTGCTYTGSLEFAGTRTGEDASAYIGGIVGLPDASTTVTTCKMNGSVSASCPADNAGKLYIGGIAGVSGSSVTNCENFGDILHSSGLGTVRIGGILGCLDESARVMNNTFSGTIAQSSESGSTPNICIGGLYATVSGASPRAFDNATDKSITMGTIQINKFKGSTSTVVYAGGFVGMAEAGTSLSFKGYEGQTNFQGGFGAGLAASTVCLGGFLGGCDLGSPAAQLSFEDIKSSGNIGITYNTSVTSTVRRCWLGGVAGYTNGPATFTGCTNVGEIGKSDDGAYCAKSNGYGEIAGGIAGYAHGGDVVFDNCVNRATVENHKYNNNGVTGVSGDMYTPPVTGGILGAFNYGTSVQSYTLSMTSCSNNADIFAYRGYTGGIVGFCYNATITSCSNTGSLSNGSNDQNAYRGGIVGGAGNATISGCQVKCDITALVYGSADYGAGGGIVGLARESEMDGDVVKIENCAYFGNVKSDKKSTDRPEYPGGILGLGTDETSVTGCKFGGTVQGITVSENNIETLVIGNAVGTVNNVTYWNGN